MTVGQILLADDEDTFREATTRFFQEEGFDCVCVRDAPQALDNLRRRRFDVLISDIRMPSNSDLQVVQEARKLDAELPVILITGYPSLETAIRSVGLAVDAYLPKPPNYDELLAHVQNAVARSQRRRSMAAVAQRLRSVIQELESGQAPGPTRQTTVEPQRLATIRTMAACLSEMVNLWAPPESGEHLGNLCQLLDCPHHASHRQAILDAIDVLARTRDLFHSKLLGDLRKRLEATVANG